MTLPRATLYTRPGCHLCEAATEHLRRLSQRYPHDLTLVDISARSDLERAYGVRIPVLAIGGREYEAPLWPAVLEGALRQAEAQTEQAAPDNEPRTSR